MTPHKNSYTMKFIERKPRDSCGGFCIFELLVGKLVMSLLPCCPHRGWFIFTKIAPNTGARLENFQRADYTLQVAEGISRLSLVN